MSKIALLVGINRYESDAFSDLQCCVDDARAMADMLDRHAEDSPQRGGRNFHCRTLTSEDTRITADSLGAEVDRLMSQLMDGGDVVFYFSGHGASTGKGGFLVTQDATPEQPGLPMEKLLDAANHSHNVSVLIILDCCHAGSIGNFTDGQGFNEVAIGPNVTVLAASGADQASSDGLEHSVFTQLVLDALKGGAADVCGHVSAGSVYAYVEQALGVWDQRPVYKSYARRLNPIRQCAPAVPDEVLARLTEWFAYPEAEFAMAPSYECTDKSARPEHTAIFDQFKLLRNAGLLTTDDNLDLYWIALKSDKVRLTPQGRLFWKRAQRGDF